MKVTKINEPDCQNRLVVDFEPEDLEKIDPDHLSMLKWALEKNDLPKVFETLAVIARWLRS